MIKIEDTTLRQMVILMLVQMADKGDVEVFQKAGLPIESLDKIRNITLDDANRLCEMPNPIMYLSIDQKSWEHSIRILSRIQKVGRDLDYYFRNGASLSMVKRLFKGHENEINSIKETHAQSISRGRPKMPPMPVRDRILMNWQRIQKESQKSNLHLREMYMELHKMHPDLRLDALDAVLENEEF